MEDSLAVLNTNSQALLNPASLMWLYPSSMTLGTRLIKLRRHYGLSQDEIGEICSVTKSSVSQWESDSTIPDIPKLTLLREKLDFSLDWLLTGIGNAPDIVLNSAITHTIASMQLMEPQQQYLAARLVDQIIESKKQDAPGQ